MNTCRPKPPLPTRPLLDESEAKRLGFLFKSLSQPTRLRIIHALIRSGELSVGELATEVGMAVQAVSNQLQRLAESRVVGCRRSGLQSFYSVIDPCVPVLFERGWCHIEEFESDGVLPITIAARDSRGKMEPV